MRRHPLLLVVALLAVVAAGCDWPNIVPTGPAPLRYRDPVFASVDVTSDVTYGTATNLSNVPVTLKLDLYEPTGDTVTARPAIVWIHGGSFKSGSKTSAELVDEATTFSKAGYVNVSINYRLESPGCTGTFSNCVAAVHEATADAQTAVAFLRANAATYGIDPTRIAVGGSSAGAITALNLAYLTSETPATGVRAAVSISGSALFLDGTIGAGDAPALDFHCTTDPLVAFSSAQDTITTAQQQGLDAFLESWDETCHVPYAEHRQQILDQTRNFLYAELDLAHAAT